MTYPRDSANARSCLAKVRYLRNVAAAIFSPSRNDMNTAHASAMAIRPGAGNAGGAATTEGSNLTRPSDPAIAAQGAATVFASSHLIRPVLLRLKGPASLP